MKRLPTKAEFKALLKLPYEWDNERKGMVFTTSNGNELFLPALGYRNGTYMFNVGKSGFYWTATPDGDSSAWRLVFCSDAARMLNYYRTNSRTVRLVSDEPCAGYIDMGTGVYWATENYNEGDKIYFTWDEAMDIQDKYGNNRTRNRVFYSGENIIHIHERAPIDWEKRRYELAKIVIHGILTMPIDPNYDSNIGLKELAHRSVEIANELIEQLKKYNNEKN